MHGLRLAIRALWWRKAVSLTILAVATISVTVAVVGPLYTRAAEESLLRDRLRSAPVSATGIEFADPSGQTSPAAAKLLGEVQAAAPRHLPPYLDPVAGLQTTQPVQLVLPGDDSGNFATRLVWRDGQCAHLDFVAGGCPARLYGVAVSAATARMVGLHVGSVLGVERFDGRTAITRLVVEGVYRPVNAREPYWFDSRLFDAHPPAVAGPVTLDSVFLTQDGISGLQEGSPRATEQYLLDVARVRLDDLRGLRRAVARADADALGARTIDDPDLPAGVQLTTNLPAVLDEVEADRRVIRSSVPLVTVQLLLLTWFVLFLVVTSVTEQRAGEVALAKLRGLGPVATSALALGEPLLLLLAAVPLGLVLALATAHGLAAAVLLPATPVQVRPTVLLALTVVLAGGAVAAALAVRRTLAEPVLAQLRGTSRNGSRRTAAVDAVVVALAVAGSYQLVSSGQLARGKGTELALLAPGMLALAVALVGVRLLPLVTGLAVRRTRRSGHVAAFLALRQISRRTAALRLVVLLAISVGLATFAVDGWRVAADNRAARAAQEVGAATVLHVEVRSTLDLLDAVRRADPGGRQAMAVNELVGSNGAPDVVAVDSERLAAVASWRRGWATKPLPALAGSLHPATPPPVELRGDRLTLMASATGLTLDTPAALVARLQHDDLVVEVKLGSLHADAGVYSAAMPCAGGCRLRSLGLDRGPGGFGAIIGSVTLQRLETSGSDATAVDAGFGQPGRWRVPTSRFRDPSRPPPTTAFAAPDGLVVGLNATGSDEVEVEPADSPYPLPALLGSEASTDATAGDEPDTVTGTGLDGDLLTLRPTATVAALPRAGRAGVLVDLTFADRLAAPGDRRTDDQVWLAAGASPAVAARLTASGVRVLSVETAAARHAVLDRAGPALALVLFLAAAVGALVLALAAVVSTVFVAGRRRSYELAAMRTFGVARSTLVRAGAGEQLILLGSGVALGAAAGLVAARLALPAVPLYAGGPVGPPVDFSPAWSALAVLLGAVTVALVLVGYLAALLLVRLSLPDRLRESPA